MAESTQVVIDIDKMTVRDMRLVMRFGKAEDGDLSVDDIEGLLNLLGRVVVGGVEDLTLLQVREEIIPALSSAMAAPKN